MHASRLRKEEEEEEEEGLRKGPLPRFRRGKTILQKFSSRLQKTLGTRIIESDA
jgi:hypothetical protein